MRLVTRDTDQNHRNGTGRRPAGLTFMVGGAVLDAIGQLKLKIAMAEVDAAKPREDLRKAHRPVRYMGRKKAVGAGPLDEKTGQGPSFDSQVHAIQLAELEVNTENGQVRILKMTTACDAGVLINPQNVEGQLHGGMDMGVGYALREQYIAGKPKIG